MLKRERQSLSNFLSTFYFFSFRIIPTSAEFNGNKIRHSSRSSSIHRSKITVDQRCLISTIFGKFSFPISIEKKDGQKTNSGRLKEKRKQTKRRKEKQTKRRKEKQTKRRKEKLTKRRKDKKENIQKEKKENKR